MGKKRVTICDHTFLDHTKSASIGGDNIGVGPTHFEWEYAEADKARFVTNGDIKHARGRGQVAWLLEPPSLHRENYEIALERWDEFDVVLFHSLVFPETEPLMISEGKFALPYGWYPYGGSWIGFDEHKMHKKSKLVSMLFSEKNTMPGHKLRHEVAERFGDKIDVLQGIPNKIDALKDYRYSIIIESEKVRYYFTEKLIDCVSVGTIPIYWGSDVKDLFDRKGIICVRNINAIESVLKIIGEKDYESRKESIRQNTFHAKKYAVCEDLIYFMYPELFNDD
jgi:hypothetical protein